jgi:type I restriction enzyme, S subunit
MKTIRFGSVAEFRNGVNYDADGAEACAKVIGVGDFGSLSRLSTFLHISEIRLSSPLSNQDCLVDGDLLFVRSNGSKKLVGRCMLIENPPALMTHSGFTIRARVDSQKYLPAFVAAIFQTEAIHKQAHLEGTGTNISNLSQQILSGIRLPSFTIQEQLEYLQRVDIWDAAIEKATALLTALEQRKQGLMQQLLIGRRRLKGFKAKWKMTRADKLFDDIAKRSQFNEQLLSVTQDRGVIPRTMLVGRVTMPSGDVNSFKLVEPDNFVISLRSFQGGLEHSAYRGLVSPAYTVLEADTAKVHAPYFRQYFKSVDFLHRLSVAVVGIRDGKQISYTDFKSIKLPLPPLPEQEAIASFLDFADSEIGLTVQRIEQLRTQKRALMQKLLSGNWRMPKTALLKEFSA